MPWFVTHRSRVNAEWIKTVGSWDVCNPRRAWWRAEENTSVTWVLSWVTQNFCTQWKGWSFLNPRDFRVSIGFIVRGREMVHESWITPSLISEWDGCWQVWSWRDFSHDQSWTATSLKMMWGWSWNWSRWWFQIFLEFSSLFGEDSQFDDHIFQMGGSTTN